jgi:hypothetical protein
LIQASFWNKAGFCKVDWIVELGIAKLGWWWQKYSWIGITKCSKSLINLFNTKQIKDHANDRMPWTDTTPRRQDRYRSLDLVFLSSTSWKKVRLWVDFHITKLVLTNIYKSMIYIYFYYRIRSRARPISVYRSKKL